MKNIFALLLSLKVFESHFPEIDFAVLDLSFLCLTSRKYSKYDIHVEAVINKYRKNAIYVTTARMQHNIYRNDESILLLCQLWSTAWYLLLQNSTDD